MNLLASHKRATAGIVAALVAIAIIIAAPFALTSGNHDSQQDGSTTSQATNTETSTPLATNTAEAKGATSKSLTAGKTHKSYDITGDKKKDSICVKRMNYSSGDAAYGKIGVYVNGKLAWSKSTSNEYFTSATARYIKLKNGKSYLWVKTTGQDGFCFSNNLLQYKGGKLKSAYDLKLSSSYGVDRGTTYKGVSGNTIKMKHSYNSATTGISSFTFSYKYKSGKLKRTSTTASVSYNAYADCVKYTGSSKWLKYEYGITAYKTSSCKSKSYSLKAKTSFKVSTIKVSSGKVYYKITNGKKSAWIKGLTRYAVLNARYA